jgi:hypothetical protein
MKGVKRLECMQQQKGQIFLHMLRDDVRRPWLENYNAQKQLPTACQNVWLSCVFGWLFVKDGEINSISIDFFSGRLFLWNWPCFHTMMAYMHKAKNVWTMNNEWQGQKPEKQAWPSNLLGTSQYVSMDRESQGLYICRLFSQLVDAGC